MLVLLIAKPFDRFTPEVDVRLLVAELPWIGRRAQRHRAAGHVKDAGLFLEVELDLLGGEAAFLIREDHVPACDEQVLIAEDLDLIGEELSLVAWQRQLDVTVQDAAVPRTLELP